MSSALDDIHYLFDSSASTLAVQDVDNSTATGNDDIGPFEICSGERHPCLAHLDYAQYERLINEFISFLAQQLSALTTSVNDLECKQAAVTIKTENASGVESGLGMAEAERNGVNRLPKYLLSPQEYENGFERARNLIAEIDKLKDQHTTLKEKTAARMAELKRMEDNVRLFQEELAAHRQAMTENTGTIKTPPAR
ncbi:hypothetical protein N657DRAFT_629583 [Parathielavia appendiculata]|uniref:Uncharacterized protein n=1 Tax=Parathielavia appendiculata TaxID=2587402 RepID=A0AAN6U8R1_9PEZI|nr:hypothetical protein N657DRAFT_629583 [Parathielavia appendiculata]